MATDELIAGRVGSHVLLLTLNRPHKRNAINGVLSNALAAAVVAAEADPSVRAVVLTGAGDRAFSAGADLDEIAAGGGEALAAGPAGLGGLVYAERSKPWIAAIRGVAAGGGFELALACDLIVAGTTARFVLPEVGRGLIAGAGGAHRLMRRLPAPLALDMLLTGKALEAQRALDFGLINRLVADAEVVPEALALAAAIAAQAPLAVAETLRIARRAQDLAEAELRDLAAAASLRLGASEDVQEGVRAFQEKRLPRWSGR